MGSNAPASREPTRRRLRLDPRIKVAAAGVVFAVLVLEVALRLFGSMHARHHTEIWVVEETGRPPDCGGLILCVGDSWTEGIGAATGNAYPDHLRRLLEAEPTTEDVCVVNRGRSAQNTAQLLSALPRQIEVLGPDVILLLCGHANQWNFQGGAEYLRRHTTWAGPLDALTRIRVFQLVQALWYFGRRTEEVRPPAPQSQTPVRSVEGVAPSIDADLDRAYAAAEDHEDLMWAYRDHEEFDLALAVLDLRVADLAPGRAGCFDLDEETDLEPDVRAELVAAFAHRAQVHFLAYDTDRSERCIALAEAARPTEFDTLVQIAEYHALAHQDDQALTWYRAATARFTPATPLDLGTCSDIARALFQAGLYSEAETFFGGAAVTSECAREFAAISRARNQTDTDPWEAAMMEWAASDIAQVIQLGRSAGADVVLHDYPALYDPYASHALAHTRSMSELAREHDVLFVSHREVFDDRATRAGSRAPYFASDGHCNDQGYGVMAATLHRALLDSGTLPSAPR